jgi:hypothetical protein
VCGRWASRSRSAIVHCRGCWWAALSTPNGYGRPSGQRAAGPPGLHYGPDLNEGGPSSRTAAGRPLLGQLPGPAPVGWPLGSAAVGPLALVRLLLATALLPARAFGHDASRSMGMRSLRRDAPQGVRGRGSARPRDGSRTRTGRPGTQPAWACHRSKRRARSSSHQTLPPHRSQTPQTPRIRGPRARHCRGEPQPAGQALADVQRRLADCPRCHDRGLVPVRVCDGGYP